MDAKNAASGIKGVAESGDAALASTRKRRQPTGGRRGRPTGRAQSRSLSRRLWQDRLFVSFCVVTAATSVMILFHLLGTIFNQGISRLNGTFLTNPPSPNTADAGIHPAMFGSLWACASCAMLALPIGVATAILLEEFKPRRRSLLLAHQVIQVNITNLAGVPSVVYGIIGLTAFAGMFGVLGTTANPAIEIGATYFDQFLSEGERVLTVPVAARNAAPTVVEAGLIVTLDNKRYRANVISPAAPLPENPQLLAVTIRQNAEAGRISTERWYHMQLPLGRSVLAGALTLMLVVLPIVITSSQEALRAVPGSLREAARGLGATPWQVVWNVTLPAATPGIMTGAILATSRAIGEAAPILMIAGVIYITSAPGNLMDSFTVMPLQIYNWAGRPQEEFHALAASGIIVLLFVLLTFNAIAVIVRQTMQRPL